MSDIHLELEQRPEPGFERVGKPETLGILRASDDALAVDADLVILAGDVHTRCRGPEWAARTFPGVPVIMLGGNHETYGDSLYANIAKNRVLASKQGALPDGKQHVNWLERETWRWTSRRGESVRVIGATLWADFSLFGPEQRLRMQAIAAGGLNDFRAIRIFDDTFERGHTRPFSPEDAARIHLLSVSFIREELAKPFDSKTIVATHHAPSPKSVAEQFRRDPLSAAYASDLEGLIAEYQPPLWCHGHTHTSFDYFIGDTRIVCNPRGYWPDELNPEFRWGKTVDI
jgi:predicted phosphodiesterase